MELKPGYEQTEVGVIPEDWEVSCLGDLAEFITSGSRGWARYYSDSGSLFIRSQNVREGMLDLSDRQHVRPPGGAEGERTSARVGDILVTITGNSVGNVAYLNQDLGSAYVSQHVGLVRLEEPKLADYICRYLSPYAPGNPQIEISQSGQSKPGLNLQNLNDFKLAIPTSSVERDAISKALCDIDSAIEQLCRLIAKKRNIKQAAMQELLTGKRRLPGFEGEWEVKRLGDLGTFLKGSGVKKNEAQSGELPCIRYGEIYTLHNDFVRSFNSWISLEVAAVATLLKRGDILFAGSGETKKEIGKCVAFLDDYEAYAGGDIVILRPTRGDSLFLSYLLNTPAVASQKASRGQGDAVVHINASALGQINLRLPPLSEQTAIVAVLREMDAELLGLEKRLVKTQALKQGMMQELLTGRTRLK